jgi:N-acetylmuramoyl-L-alanine amidase
MWQRRWILVVLVVLIAFGIGLSPKGRPAWSNQPDCPPNFPVIIDPGHGGLDGGAATEGAVEKELVLDISLRLRDELQRRKIPVVMTRATDVGFGPVRSDLAFRSLVANNCKASLFLSIHINSVPNTKQAGFVLFYGAGRPSRDAAILIDRMLREAGLHRRQEVPHHNRTFAVIHATAAPALLLELGFLTNPGDRTNLQSASYRQQIAQVLGEAAAKIYHDWIE